MPYDRTWARTVFYKYWELHPRAQQIDRCLLQLIARPDEQTLLVKALHDFLIDSIQGKAYKGLWNEYKRLIKRSPLDRTLLYRISTKLSSTIKEDPMQILFDFTEKTT